MNTEKSPAPVKTCPVLRIDAWRNADGGWDWNSWHKVGAADVAICGLSTRALLARMRSAGYLSAYSAGRVSIEDDQYNVVIKDRGTGEPLLAIAYGEVI